MPELPEVETVASRLDARLRGAVVESVRLIRPDVVKHGRTRLARTLRRRRIARIHRHGKRILCELDPPAQLNVHLGMTGNLLLEPRASRPAPHTHLRVGFVGHDDELRFRDPRRFGGIWLAENGMGPAGRFSRPLGPDALGIRLPEFRELLRRDRQIKALLMDQQCVAGLGNIYCDESLHRAGIHPLVRASSLSDDRVRALLNGIRRVLRAAIAAGGSSLRDYVDADGEPGWFRVEHRVYDREGEPCTRCDTAVERAVIASRSAHFCPVCQPAPGPRRRRRRKSGEPRRDRA